MFAPCFATWQMPFQMSSPQGEGKDTLPAKTTSPWEHTLAGEICLPALSSKM